MNLALFNLIKEIIFTSGGTESNNLVLNSAIKHFWNFYAKKKSEGTITNDSIRPHIISSSLEHDSIKLVLEHFQQQKIAGQKPLQILLLLFT